MCRGGAFGLPPASMFVKFSFRQFLLTAFLAIVALLGAASVQALLTLERIANHSRDTARSAVQLTEDAQHLAERTVAMERSARQFLVLDDTAFRQRYRAAWEDAQAALQSLARGLPQVPPAWFESWQLQGEQAWRLLQGSAQMRRENQDALYQIFHQLPLLNEQLARESKREVERRNSALQVELEQQRGLLSAQVIGAIVLAALFAFGFGLWLSRPLARVGAVINRLGQNRFDQPIDISGPADLRRLGQQLEWLRLRLAELEDGKARFLRHVSHELKTPLASLREGIALLEEEVAGPLSPNQREIAGILRHNAMTLQAQIEALLRYNAAAFDAQQLQCAPADLREVLLQVIEAQRLQWQARGVEIELNGPSVRAVIDADRLKAGLANLLSNAVRFSPAGGCIRFTLASGDGAATIDCTDEGPGIADADAARIFEPFYQGTCQPAGTPHGSGIGLSIVREYVAAHRGVVKLMPAADGIGAHFRIELPHEA